MTNRRRYLIYVAILAACVCIAIGVLAMLRDRPGVTKANYDRIAIGMTRAEVAAILGEPSDKKGSAAYYDHFNGSVAIVFFDGDKVRNSGFIPSIETLPAPCQNWAMAAPFEVTPRIECVAAQPNTLQVPNALLKLVRRPFVEKSAADYSRHRSLALRCRFLKARTIHQGR